MRSEQTDVMTPRYPTTVRNRSRCVAPLLALSLALAHAAEARAGAMTKNIEAVRPRIGQRGRHVEVAIRGISLGDPREIVFYRPGIRAVNIQPAVQVPQRSYAHGGRVVEEVRCAFEIARDCPIGEHPFRLLTATELTCIATFHVSPFATIDEEEANNSYSNDTPATARAVAANTTVRGQIDGGDRGDRDLYRIDATAGQRLSIEVESVRIADQHYGDSEFDLALRVLDDRGRVVAANDDNSLHLQDPLVSFKAPRDGPFYVEVRRSIFVPSETLYCLHIGHHARPLAAYPPGGQAGTQQTIVFKGDVLGDVQQPVSLPSGARDYFYFGGDEQMPPAPTPLRLRVSPYANVMEDDSADETRVAQLPAALNGIIDSDHDADRWRLSVKKGDRWHVRVFAAALGSPIDAAIRVLPIGDDGQPGPAEWELDDSPLADHDILGTSFRGGGGLQEAIDPSLIWEPKRDGDYVLEVRDTSGAGGPLGIYRVEVEPPHSAVQTLLASGTFDWTESTRVTGLAIPRGNRWTIDLSLPRGQWNSLAGEFDLIAHGLPEGVRLVTPRVKAGAARWPIQFIADASARPQGSVFTLEARPVDPSVAVETRCQQNVPFLNHPGGSAWRTVRTDRYIVGVTDPAPFSIDIEQPSAALVRGGELAIPVKIRRREGFGEAIEIRCGGMDRSISTPPPMIVPADQNAGELVLGADGGAPLEAMPLYVIGSTVRDDIDDFLGSGHRRVSSEIVRLEIAQPYLELASQPESIRRGERKAYTWNVRHHTPFEGEAHVTLLGLPKGVAVVEPSPVLTKDSQTVSFELTASGEALLGQSNGLTCEVKVPVGGQQIVQRTGRGALRIDPAKDTK
ncbi:MAG TPA: PPC domain-containing protein [Pirellulales bacterium]|nr:PPC domain-containing protein [Pirellulales bacterium]